MKDLRTLLATLDRDTKSGKLLPTPFLVEECLSARPLDRDDLRVLAGCLTECSEQIYEYYRPLIDLFREESRRTRPDEETIQTAVALGIWDDEEMEG